MTELKPCPFCGGESEIRLVRSGIKQQSATIMNEYNAGCGKCNIWTSCFESEIRQDQEGYVRVEKTGVDEAIEAWNKRW